MFPCIQGLFVYVFLCVDTPVQPYRGRLAPGSHSDWALDVCPHVVTVDMWIRVPKIRRLPCYPSSMWFDASQTLLSRLQGGCVCTVLVSILAFRPYWRRLPLSPAMPSAMACASKDNHMSARDLFCSGFYLPLFKERVCQGTIGSV